MKNAIKTAGGLAMPIFITALLFVSVNLYPPFTLVALLIAAVVWATALYNKDTTTIVVAAIILIAITIAVGLL